MRFHLSGVRRYSYRGLLVALLTSASAYRALADASPAPGLVPAQPVWQNSVEGFVTFIDQATGGPGTQPPEGLGFAAGSPLSPMTPYDTFSSAPLTPGVAGTGQFSLFTTYRANHLKASLRTTVGAVTGSITNAAYWSENLMPLLNPHLGSGALPYKIVFPAHAGQDDGSAGAAQFEQLSVGADDDRWNVRAGYFDLAQTNRFVFVQPPLTNQTPQISLATAESLGNGPPQLNAWPSPPVGLPLDGLDVVLHDRSASAEFTDAKLPALAGTAARLTNASVFLDRGSQTQFSAQIVHLVTGGTPISTTTLFGAGATVVPGPQGFLPISELGGQTATIAGVHAAFAVATALDVSADYGRTWYDADGVLEPGTAKPGDYWRAGLAHPLGDASFGLEVYRFEARYAPAILPYGVPENIWSVAWSWPGVWLKSTYQLVDNSAIGANRQGYRARYTRDGKVLQVHGSFAEFRQIDPASFGLSNQVGFVEGFFLPQRARFITHGSEKQVAAWVGWHPRALDVSVDFVDDMMHRDAALDQPQDAVSYEAPQLVVTLSKNFNGKVVGALGFARYAMLGSWAHGSSTNVDFQQNVAFAGAQYAESAHAMVLVQVRHSAFAGLPSIQSGISPDFHGSLLVLEERLVY